MSMDNVENLHIRVRQELDHLGLSLAEAARRMGEPDSQGVRDVCSGRKRVTAEFLAKLVAIGGDVLFVLTGRRSSPTPDTHTEALLMLQSRGIYPDGRGGGSVSLAGLALLLNYIREAKGARPVALTERELAKIARFAPKDARAWVLQPVALTPREGGPTSNVLLIYGVKTPVSLLWQLGPYPGQIPPRLELTGWPHFPIKARADDEDHEDLWELDLSSDGSFEVLDKGEVLDAEIVTVEAAQREANVVIEEMLSRSVSIHIGGDVGQSIASDQTNTGPVSFSVGKGRK